MSFADILDRWPSEVIRERIQQATTHDVDRVLAKETLNENDLCVLLSDAARQRLETMAQRAHKQTRRFFGRVIGLYAPIYISNVCGADCVYCGYAVRSGSRLKRLTLKEPEIRQECEALKERGFQHVLLLTGEAPSAVPVKAIAQAVAIAREYFASVSVEVYALDEADYRQLVDVGLEGVTLYMETYHRETYAVVHLKGKKRDFEYRLDAIERAGKAGVRRLSIGALLGLYDWRLDGFWTILHARYLQKTCWQSAVALSFPRLIHTPPRFQVPQHLTDKDLVHLMVAARLFLPEVGFNLSTRERASLRDRLIPLGVTMMSAGSSTRPGGYSIHGEETLEQFEIEDNRSPAEVAEAIRRAGYEPVWKDFDPAFVSATD